MSSPEVGFGRALRQPRVRHGRHRPIFNDEPVAQRAKTIGVYVVLIAINALAWIWRWPNSATIRCCSETASLAYTFGLRHGVDPDHIAAIDNVTRKLMQEGKRPLYAGFSSRSAMRPSW